MTQQASMPIREEASAPAGLSSAVGSGMIWMAALSLSTKFMSLLAQVVLTARLTKTEWAIGGLAISLSAFPAVLQSAGLASVLVHRQRAFHLWSRGAASLGGFLGIIAASAIVLVGYLAAPRYHAPELFDLMIFVGATVLINSLTAVPAARLQIDLRYQTVARVGMVASLVTATMSAAMAFYGLGPYACVAPQVLAATFNCVLLWRHAHEPFWLRFDRRVWKYLFADGSAIIITNMMWAVGNFGDNVIVSIFASKEKLAIYYFAYTVSFQIVQMIAVNAQTVLFPAFSKLLNEPERQAKAFIRAARLLASLTYPLIAGLAFCAPKLLTLVYGSKWDDAVPLIRVLCVGMGAFMVSMCAGSLIMAQGRFRAFMFYAIYSAAQFLLLVGVGAWLLGVLGVGIAVALHHWLAGNVGVLLGIRRSGLGVVALRGIYAPALLSTGIMLACTIALARFVLPDSLDPLAWLLGITYFDTPIVLPSRTNPLAWLVGVSITGAMIYAVALRLISPAAFEDSRAQLANLAGKITRKFGRAPR